MTQDDAGSAAADGGAQGPSDEEIAARWERGLRRWGVGLALLGTLAVHPFWEGPCVAPFWRMMYVLLVALGVVLVVRAASLARYLAPREITREHIYSFALALVLALTIRTFVVQAFKIPSGSMLPTLQIGDHLLVSKFLYGVRVPFTDKVLRFTSVRDPERGDIIVFRNPDDECVDYIKRIIGLPGETIEIRNRRIFIDGEAIEDPWGRCDDGRPINDPTALCSRSQRADYHRPFKIPADHYFMMGDNRQRSQDSRYWTTAKTVQRDKIIGKAWRIYWSWAWKDGLRIGRLGDAVE